MEVTNGPNYPYYYVNQQGRKIFIRHGDRSEKATSIEQNNLLLRGLNKSFDALPTSIPLSDVSFTLMAATFKQKTGESFNYATDLTSMGFMTDDGQITNAGLLMSDQGLLKQSKIVCTRWKGNQKGSIDGDALDDAEFSDASLITLLTNAETFVKVNSKKPWTIVGMTREERSDYPFKAVREVLVNALIHRDYQIRGSEVHVDMFDDRIEVMSPGGMMNGSRIQDLNLKKVPSMRRNEIISDFFSRLHYMDRRGSGIQRILESYENFVEQPDFYSDDTIFWVTLPNRGVATLVKKNKKIEQNKEKTSQEFLEDVEIRYKSKLSEEFRQITINKIMDFFNKYEFKYSFNRDALATHLKVTSHTASKYIQKCIKLGIMRKESRGIYFFNKLF